MALAADDVRGDAMSRRRVLAGTAWATPAVIVALAAPASATSPTPTDATITAELLSASYRGRQVQFRVTVTTASLPFDANFTVLVAPGDPTKVTGYTYDVAGTAWVGAGATATHGAAQAAGQSTSFTVTVNYQSNNDHGPSTFTLRDNDLTVIDADTA